MTVNPDTSLCPDCGAGVYLFEGSTYDRLREKYLTGFLSNGPVYPGMKKAQASAYEVPRERHVYVAHGCDPVERDAHESTMRGLAERTGKALAEAASQVVGRTLSAEDVQGEGVLEGILYPDLPVGADHEADRLRRAVANADKEVTRVLVEAGMARRCPRCGARVGAVCENLTERRRGRLVHTARPHVERVPAPDDIPGGEYMRAVRSLGDAAAAEDGFRNQVMRLVADSMRRERRLQGLLKKLVQQG